MIVASTKFKNWKLPLPDMSIETPPPLLSKLPIEEHIYRLLHDDLTAYRLSLDAGRREVQVSVLVSAWNLLT